MTLIQSRRYIENMPLTVSLLTMVGFFLVFGMGAEAKAAGPFSAEFSLPGSHGYRVSVAGQHHEVTVSVSQGGLRSNHFVDTVYTAQAAVSLDGIDANFGALGEMALRFVPSGKVIMKRRRLPADCHAPRNIVRKQGTFVGVVRFEGEAGYTIVNATEVNGSVGTPEGILCASFGGSSTDKGNRDRHPHLPSRPYLAVATAHHALSFAAAAIGHRGQKARFAASSTEKNGAISIFRWASVVAARSDFTSNRNLTTASVTPPPPFSGTATLRRRQPNGAPPSWTGSLAVSFAGASDVPLTGSDFTTLRLAKF